MVETLRQQNMREQRRLQDRLTNRQGMKAAYNYEIASLSYEQRKLRQEILKIKQSTPASASVWSSKSGRTNTEPMRTHNQNHVMLPGQSMQASNQPHVQRLVVNHQTQPQCQPPAAQPQTHLPVLHTADCGTHVSHEPKARGRQMNDSGATYGQEEHRASKIDPQKLNPDGSVRTRNAMPDFKKTMKEAQKARYVRHKEKQWFEKELTVGEIFNKDTEQQEVVR